MRHIHFKQLLPPRFDWREHNHFELLVDGEQFFPRMLAAIDQAQHRIDLEMYLVGSGRVFTQFRQALLDAAKRGVHIRILLDDFGAQALSAADRQALAMANIEMLFFNRLRWRKGVSNLLRNHRKLLLVDGQLAFTGGAGLTDEFLNEDPHLTWHEVMLQVRGPSAADWQRLFERTWLGLRKELFKSPRHHALPPAGQQRGRVCASSGPRAHHVIQSLYQQVQRARQRVWLITPYFLPALKLRRLLIDAARRHVDVRVLVPGQVTDHPAIRHASRRHYARLLRQGVRLFEYQPRFVHAKIALCDEWVSIGSTNFDRWNLLWNLDANQEVDDPVFATQVHTLMEADFADCDELHYASWQLRPLYLRGLEWFTGKLDELLLRLR